MRPANDTPSRIIQLWMEISRLLRQKMSSAKKMSHMNPMQMHGLFIIAEHPNITMKELAEALHVTSPSATSFVDRLVKLKWVKRSADRKNRKLVRLSLKPAGTAALRTGMKQHSAMMHELFSLLSNHDQKQFERVLLNLKEALALHVSSH